MNRQITNFRFEEYGLFLDIQGGEGRIAVSPATGDILLDEGEGENCFNGAVITPATFESFELTPTGEMAEVAIIYDNRKRHVIGVGSLESAEKWITEATKVILKTQSTALAKRASDLAVVTGHHRTPLRVVVVDDHSTIREMLTFIIPREGNFEIVGQADSGIEGLRMIERLKPDIATIDLVLPKFDGLSLLTAVRKSTPHTRCIVYSGTTSSRLIRSVLDLNPSGFVLKEDSLAILRLALLSAAAGRTFISPSAKMMGGTAHYGRIDLATVTEVERLILQGLWKGLSDGEIAERIGIGARKVASYWQDIGRRIGAPDRKDVSKLYDLAGLVWEARVASSECCYTVEDLESD